MTVDRLGEFVSATASAQHADAGGSRASDISGHQILNKRTLNAPRDLVFRMWTEKEHVTKWWGPTGFTTTIFEMDVRPGGVWNFAMHGPDGRDYQNKDVYVEVIRPERLVFDHVSEPLHRMTVNFKEVGDKTEVSVQMLFESAEMRNKVVEEYGAEKGLGETLNRLAEELAKL
jgi:uncharacterized protein YndB with AHSA1/START domain